MHDYFERCLPEQAGIDVPRLLELCTELQKPQYGLHALLLLRQGKVFYESYAAPYKKGERHSLFSVSKSFTAVAVLFALQEGLLSLEDKVAAFFPEKLPAPPCPNMEKLAVQHLLTMTPGLSAAPHNFRYPHLDDVINDFPYSYENFTYENQVDWVADFLHSYLPNPPGEKFIYCSACTYMLSAILQKRTGQTLLEYLQPRLLSPLGIFDARWQKCPSGIEVGGWGLSLCVESLAKFGQFLLQEGKWEGRQLLNAGYVREMRSCQVLIHTPGRKVPEQFGYQVWVEGEQSIFSGVGAFGQAYIVLPEQDAVAVMLSGSMQDLRAVQILRKKLPKALQSADSNPTARQALQTLAAGAHIPPPKGASSDQEPLAQEYSNVEYSLAPNYFGFTSIRFSFGAQDSVTVSMGRRSSTLPIGYGRFFRGNMPVAETIYHDVHNQLVFPAAACAGAWQGGKYVLRIAYTNQPYLCDMTVEFLPHGLRIENKRNVSGFVASANTPIMGYRNA